MLMPIADALAAPSGDRRIGGDFDGADAVVEGVASKTPGGRGARSGAPGVERQNAYRYSYTVICGEHIPAADASVTPCADGGAVCPPGQLRHWVYRSPTGVEPPSWRQMGTLCMSLAEAGMVEFPGFTIADLRRLPLPAADPVLQPGNGFALLNVPANVYAQAEPVELATEVVGFPARVRATPARFRWAFGDGATLGPTDDPGAPYPQLRLTHTYTEPGSYAVTLTTLYTGQYSVAGGPWLPIDGEAEVASPPLPVQALAGRNALVAEVAQR
jgi:hypothetical protein